MKNSSTKKVMQGALVLSIASIIAKILSAVYRVPLQNLVGNTGFYVYQQIYPIYGIGMTFALNGFPIFISKIIAEEPDQQKKLEISRYALLILSILSVIAFAFLIGGASIIAQTMGDVQLTPLIRVVATMFLLMPLLATGRGYFQGIYDVLPTAKSQVAEQIVRVSIIILVAVVSVKMNWSVYKMGTWAMVSSTCAAVVSSMFFIGWGWKLIKLPKMHFDVTFFKKLSRRFLIEGGLICLLAAIMILLQLIDSFTVKNNLVVTGVSQSNAKALKGVFDRGQPLVQLGTVIATSFATTLLPSLTTALQKRDTKVFYRSATSLFRVSLSISMAASIGMMALMPEINYLLFGSTEGTWTLAVYNLSIIFAALIFVYNSILQSMGANRATLVAILMGLSCKVFLNGWAVRLWGIWGASLITVVSLGLIAWKMNRALPGTLAQKVFKGQHFLVKLLLGNLCMLIIVVLVRSVMVASIPWDGRLSAILVIFVGVLVGVIVFGGYVFKFKLFSIKEWLTIPYGLKILRIIQRMTK